MKIPFILPLEAKLHHKFFNFIHINALALLLEDLLRPYFNVSTYTHYKHVLFYVNLILQEGLLTEEQLDEILNPVNMTEPGISAKNLILKKEQ